MTRVPIDRGAPSQGLQLTLRDHRVPFNMVRALKNFRMPDGRLRRRRGFSEYMTSPTRVHGNQLAKHSGASLQQVPFLPSSATINLRKGLWKTPMSYGVLKWHDDFQPKIGRDFCVEFLVTIGEEEPLVNYDPQPATTFSVETGFHRISPTRNNAAFNFEPRGLGGVFVYDQSIIANDCTFDDGGSDITLPTSPDDTNHTNPSHFDCVVLPALAIAYNKAIDGGDAGKVRFEVEWTIFDSGNNKYQRFGTDGLIRYAHEAYVAGTTYHLAVTFDTIDDKVRLYIDGVLVATSTDVRGSAGANAKWAGEEDYINDIDAPIHRDIVIMNECVVRGNYASTCSFMNRSSVVSTNGGDWTEDSTSKWSYQLRSDSSKKSVQAVWTHDRTPESVDTCNGIDSSYHPEAASVAAMSSNGDWFYDSATGKLHLFSTTPSSPVARWTEVELIFDFIGSPNLIPHMLEGSVTSGGNDLQISQPSPWACSPPRGTAMSELRIWHEPRSAANLLANKLIRVSTGGNLKGYWYLNDGSGVLIDQVAGQRITIHHGPPSWVKDTSLLGSLGISISEGQHLIKSFRFNDSEFYVDDVFRYLEDFLFFSSTVTDYDTATAVDTAGDFTAMIQIRTPFSYQQSISRHGDAVRNRGAVRFDGGTTRTFLREFSDEYFADSVVCYAQSDGHRSTLFSIEGTVRRATTGDPIDDVKRLPLAQAFIDETGSVQFEMSQRWESGGTGFPSLERVVAGKSIKHDGLAYAGSTGGNHLNRFNAASTPFTSADNGLMAIVQTTDDRVVMVSKVTFVDSSNVDLEYYWDPLATHKITIFDPLDADTTYTITCRQKTEDRGAVGISSVKATWMDIFVDGTKLIQARIDGSAKMVHQANYDIIIGAAMVNDATDESVTHSNLLAGAEVIAGRPPWQKAPPLLEHSSQHFMTHHQDQPGDFILGFFRLWAGLGVSDELIGQSYGSALEPKFHDAHLVFNLELDQMTGLQFPSRGRYPVVFDTGYKSYGGGPHAWLLTGGGKGTAVSATPDPLVPAGWSMEDRLGFIPQPEAFDNQYTEAVGKMIAPFNSTLRQQGGILALFDDSLLFDKDLDGTFSNVYLSAQGLMNDFGPGTTWEGVVIGDRTIMVSQGGVPKVFNGRVCTKAGMSRWGGGRYITEMLADGVLTKNMWYHARLVFHDDNDQLQSVSEPIIFKTTDSNRRIRVKNISQHPDPRITSLRIYLTPGHETESNARGDTPRLSRIGLQTNMSRVSGDSGIIIGNFTDSSLHPVVLALDIMPVPQMSTATSHNGRLVGAGNPLVPDAWFWSVAGNPETFLESSIGILEEGTGDRIVKVLSAFGSVFVFKTNSVWRLDETQPGSINPWVTTKLVESVGAVSNRAVCLHVDPDTGRSFIFFWSKHGPYIFDGASFIYVGQPLEQNLDAISWDWADIERVSVIHDISEREIISYMRLTGKDRNDVAYSFHYRNSSFEEGRYVWSEYTGVLGEVGFTILAVDDTTVAGTLLPGAISTLSLTLGAEDKFFPLVAGKNGMVYKWGDSDYDGHPVDANDYTSKFTVFTYSSGLLTVTQTPGWQDIRGLWATIIKSDYSDFFIIPILYNGTDAFTVDTNYAAIGFTPNTDDIVYIGRPPAQVEFPWDMLEIPFKNKQLLRIMLWYDKDFYFRWRRDWDTAWEKAYAILTDSAKKRVHQDLAPAPMLEAFKMELVSYEIAARLDSYGYIIAPADKEDLTQ